MRALFYFLCCALLFPATVSRADAPVKPAASPISKKTAADSPGSSEWIEKKVAAGDMAAIVELGVKYVEGDGVPRDGQQALRLFVKAATVGSAEAERSLGVVYATGAGVAKDQLKARDWFEAAARHGDVAAILDLGHNFLGDPRGPYYDQAFEWINRAASYGHPIAEADLGALYQQGLGVAPDNIEALKWLLLAVDAKYKDAIPRRDELLSLTDPAQQREARARAGAFQPRKKFAADWDVLPAATCPMGEFSVISVTLFGESRSMMVDTGATFTGFDAAYTNRLTQLGANAKLENAPLQFEFYDSPEIFIGRRRFAPRVALTADLGKLSESMDGPLAGVLGMNLMGDYVVTFDSDHHTFTLGGAVPESVKKNALSLPLKATNGCYTVDAVVNGQGPFALLLDTGNSGAISLKSPAWKKVFPATIKSRITRSIGIEAKVMTNRTARLPLVTLGTNTYTNLLVETDSDFGGNSYAGALGQKFFRRHLCVFDFPHQTLYLLPSKEFADPDLADMSGLAILKVEGKITVYSAEEDAPAFAAGLRAHDEIISFNGRPASSLKLSEIREALSAKPGDQIRLRFRRGDKIKSVKFALKELL